jgi:23S rRNA (guanosine2251-2'-O)-methyltransferase
VNERDSDYQRRRRQFRGMLTVYGRKSVLEALRDSALPCHALHLADSNRDSGIIRDMLALAAQRNIPIQRHSREALSRISRNGRQDQGVAADIVCPAFQEVDAFLAGSKSCRRLLALDGISNPQNAGMIIRSAVAAGVDGIIYPDRGNAALGPLLIKASVGTVFRAPLLRCERLLPALQACREDGFTIFFLDGGARASLFDPRPEQDLVYVLGGETEGVSTAVQQMADGGLAIPMSNSVESLNVAVSAALVAYAGYLRN